MNLSDTGVSPAKLAVVLLIAAVLAVDIAVLWLISRNSLAEARTFFKDNFYFKRIKLVYPTPVPKHNTPKEQLKHLFHNIREEGKQKLQKEHEGGSGYGSGYGTAYGLDSSYDGTGASASASAPEYGVEHNKLFGKVFGTSASASAPDYGYAEEQDNKLFGKLFSRPAKPSWSPVSGPPAAAARRGRAGPRPRRPSTRRQRHRSWSPTRRPPPRPVCARRRAWRSRPWILCRRRATTSSAAFWRNCRQRRGSRPSQSLHPQS